MTPAPITTRVESAAKRLAGISEGLARVALCTYLNNALAMLPKEASAEVLNDFEAHCSWTEGVAERLEVAS